MSWRVLTTKAVPSIAAKYCPVIAQEIKGLKDFPTGMIFTDKNNAEQLLPSIIMEPVLYYRISIDHSYLYAFYMVFHPFDWAKNTIPFINHLDEHQYDTESMVFQIPLFDKFEPYRVITVFHNTFKYKKYDRDLPHSYWGKVYIEPYGHGIIPWGENPRQFEYKPMLMVYSPSSIKLENFDDHKQHWGRIKQILNSQGVNFVDQQQDYNLSSVCEYPNLRHMPGDMFNRPHILFERARKENLFK